MHCGHSNKGITSVFHKVGFRIKKKRTLRYCLLEWQRYVVGIACMACTEVWINSSRGINKIGYENKTVNI